MARALSSWSTAAISVRPTPSSSGRSGESLRSIFGSRSPRGWEDDLKTIPSDIELPMKRLGHAPSGFQGFRAETARRGNVRSQSNNWEIGHAGNHRGVQDPGEGEALVFVEGIDLLSDSVSGTLGHPGTDATGISPAEFLLPDRRQSVGRVNVPTLHHPGGRASPRTSWPCTVTPWIPFSAREVGPERSRKELSCERYGYMPAVVRNDWCMRTHRSPTRRQAKRSSASTPPVSRPRN